MPITGPPRRSHLWAALLASVTVAGCASAAPTVAPTAPPPLRQLLLAGSASQVSDPCQGSFFVSESASAIGSAGKSFVTPPVQEFVLRYKSAAAAAKADASRQTTELSSNWLCSMRSQCPGHPGRRGPAKRTRARRHLHHRPAWQPLRHHPSRRGDEGLLRREPLVAERKYGLGEQGHAARRCSDPPQGSNQQDSVVGQVLRRCAGRGHPSGELQPEGGDELPL